MIFAAWSGVKPMIARAGSNGFLIVLMRSVAAEIERSDDDAVGNGADVVAEPAQGDGRSDLLRHRHLPQIGAPHLLVGGARRDDLACGHERRARADEREQRLEHARPPLEDVDEVDPARSLRRTPSLHAHERRHRMCPVGQEDVVVRRDEIEDDTGDDEQGDETGGDLRRADGAAHQNSAC